MSSKPACDRPQPPPPPDEIDRTHELTARELTLRKLPLQYSLALRLRDAGVAPDVICDYLAIDKDRLAGLFQMAEEKFDDARALIHEADIANTAESSPRRA